MTTGPHAAADPARASSPGGSAQFTAKDYDKALLTPAQVFGRPVDVVATGSLTAEQKLNVLKRWEADARDLDVAAGENMAGGERSRLGEVRAAILALCEREDIDESNPAPV